MAWIEVHQTLPPHRKIKKFKRNLNIKTPQAVGHMVMLWLWAIDNAPDGDLSGIDPDDIAEAAEWPKDGKAFVDALIDSGFLDVGMQLHDWVDYVGKLMEKRETKRENDRERQRRAREKKKLMEGSGDGPTMGNDKSLSLPDDPSCHAPVTRDDSVTSRICHALNRTLPYPTEQNQNSTMEVIGENSAAAPTLVLTPPDSVSKIHRRKYGEYGWVRLSDDEHARLLAELGEEELQRCITYVDESAQSTGNRNKWKDWNLVVRKCAKQGWGRNRKPDQRQSSSTSAMEDLQKIHQMFTAEEEGGNPFEH